MLLQEALIKWQGTSKSKPITKCVSGRDSYLHPLASKFEPFINKEIKSELEQAMSYAIHLSEGATELKLLKSDKEKHVKNFMNYSQELGQEIDEINI